MRFPAGNDPHVSSPVLREYGTKFSDSFGFSLTDNLHKDNLSRGNATWVGKPPSEAGVDACRIDIQAPPKARWGAFQHEVTVDLPKGEGRSCL